MVIASYNCVNDLFTLILMLGFWRTHKCVMLFALSSLHSINAIQMVWRLRGCTELKGDLPNCQIAKHSKYIYISVYCWTPYFLFPSSPANDWRNLDGFMFGMLVGRSVGSLQLWGTRDVQVIQSFSRDGKTIKYVEMLEC